LARRIIVGSMATRHSATERGSARARRLLNRTGEELATARRTSGLSQREVGRRLRVSHARVARAERGDPAALTIEFAARYAAVVGLELAVSLHPAGDPVRDRGHLALLERLRARLGPGLRWRTEVPVPIPGDLRAADAVIRGAGFEILVEAETRLEDVQALERRFSAKQRDLGLPRGILLVADTRHNRRVIEAEPELTRRYPVDARRCLADLARGRSPSEDAIVIL
jgi:transcriptional regulator with XRE-family HTH domain